MVEEETAEEHKIVKAKDEKKSKKKKEKVDVILHMDHCDEVIFGRGLTREDVKVILLHILDLVPPETVTKTRHKNFVRAMIPLIVYVYYLNEIKFIHLESMVDKNTGYVDSFEFSKPLTKDAKYTALLKELFEEARSERDGLIFHPTFEELVNWSGNMHNYICVTLKALYMKEGFCKKWNHFLYSIGIDMDELIK